MFEDYDDVVTLQELSEMLRIGRNTTYKLLNKGKINAYQNGRKWIIPKLSVIHFLMNNCNNKPT